MSFGADTAALPHGFVVAAAATFGLNLKTPWGTALLLLILADVVFRPENPAKRGRPSGTKKWNQRELANLGFRAAIIETNKPGIKDYDTALELQKIDPKEYGYMTENTLRQLIPNALQAHKARLAALRAPKSTLQN